MSAITLPDFKIRYVLTALLYLVTCVTLIQSVNYFGVWLYGLEFLNWWPLGQAMLFGLGGTPDSILNLNTSGLAIELAVPGLEAEFQQHWLARAGLALVTTGLFLVILFTMRQMLVTLDIKNPFDPANIKRVQLIIALLLVDVFGLDYLRTESMARVKTLVEQMGAPILRTDQSYQNADVHAYVLLVLLLTLVAVFRRGLILHEKQREMEKKLYQKQKLEAVGALASGIGHDFNNMLTSIIGYAEIAKSEPEKQDVDFAIARVLDASYRAQRLTQQIRAVGGQHKDTGQDERIDLKEEIEELLLSIEPTVPEQIQIVKSFDSTRTYPIKADPIKIYQVLLNLSTNALQSMENTSGTLEFCLLPKNRNGEPGFVLSIEDQGSGMSEAVQQQIFEPYFSTRKGHGGTGLGLAICYSLIQSYQGAIDVDSKSGRGTRFDIWLPEAKLDETNQAPGMSKDSPPHKFNRARILVVEDETSVRNLIKHQLSKLGYQISAYASAQEALTDMSKAQLTFDLVVSDFDLGDSTGVALANELNALKLPLPMLIVTATPEKVDDAIASGLIFDVLSKPIAFSELRASIERALSHEKEQRSANFAGKSVA